MLRRLYTLGWYLAVPLALAYLLYRSIRQPDYRRHWSERFGFAPGARERWLAHERRLGNANGDRPIWIHAVSVGETAAAAPLIRRLGERYPQLPLLLTHATPTGRAAGADLFRDLAPRLSQCYLPYDLPSSTRRFLARQRPLCGLIMETEVWPNLMRAAQARQVPMAAVNARLSQRSLARGMKYGRLIGPAIAAFEVIVAQTAADSDRIAQLARPADAVSGNLKFDQAVSPDARKDGRRWRERLGTRPVILAASTRDGEETLILQSLHRMTDQARQVQPGTHAPLLIIVPRHPNRFEAVAALIESALPGQGLMRRAALDRGDADLTRCPVLLGDSMGEMQRWYACADAVIMGGSLLPFGSQNLIEANALGCPVVLGPSVFNFEQAARESIAAGAAVQVADSDAALAAALRIATSRQERGAMSQAALAFTQAHRGSTERTLQALAPFLTRSLAAPRTP